MSGNKDEKPEIPGGSFAGVSLNSSDYMLWAGVSAAGFPLSRFIARPSVMRGPGMLMGGFICTLGGLGMAYCRAAARAREKEFQGR